MAILDTISDITTVASACSTSVLITKMKSKWIRYWGPSCVARVQMPIVLPNGKAFLHISVLLSIQKESRTVARSIFSLMKARLQLRSILGRVCSNVLLTPQSRHMDQKGYVIYNRMRTPTGTARFKDPHSSNRTKKQTSRYVSNLATRPMNSSTPCHLLNCSILVLSIFLWMRRTMKTSMMTVRKEYTP